MKNLQKGFGVGTIIFLAAIVIVLIILFSGNKDTAEVPVVGDETSEEMMDETTPSEEVLGDSDEAVVEGDAMVEVTADAEASTEAAQ